MQHFGKIKRKLKIYMFGKGDVIGSILRMNKQQMLGLILLSNQNINPKFYRKLNIFLSKNS
jgi:NAD kinase